MKKFVIAPALAALAMFVFGAIYWMSPLPYKALTPVANNAATSAALAQIFPATGTYLIPGPDMTDTKQLQELYERGPSVKVDFVKEGYPMMDVSVFVKGYLHYFVVALLLAMLLDRAKGSLPRYGSRVSFSTLVGLAGAVLISLSDPIWWHHPWGFHLMTALYAVLAFMIAGLVLAKFIKPETA